MIKYHQNRMLSMRKKSIIYFFVIALVIGFASVATNLIINNTLNIGFNNTFLDDRVSTNK